MNKLAITVSYYATAPYRHHANGPKNVTGLGIADGINVSALREGKDTDKDWMESQIAPYKSMGLTLETVEEIDGEFTEDHALPAITFSNHPATVIDEDGEIWDGAGYWWDDDRKIAFVKWLNNGAG